MHISVTIKHKSIYGHTESERVLSEDNLDSMEDTLSFLKLVLQAATFIVRSDENLELVREPIEVEPPPEHEEPVSSECDEEDCTLCTPKDTRVLLEDILAGKRKKKSKSKKRKAKK